MNALIILALAGAVIFGGCLVLVYALCRMAAEDPDEPAPAVSAVDALDRMGDEVTYGVILDFRKPYRRNGGGWIA